MKEYTVRLTGLRKDGSTPHAEVATKAESCRMAVLQVSGMDPRALQWDGFYDDGVVDIIAYSVIY
jgi:hypothetical protein